MSLLVTVMSKTGEMRPACIPVVKIIERQDKDEYRCFCMDFEHWEKPARPRSWLKGAQPFPGKEFGKHVGRHSLLSFTVQEQQTPLLLPRWHRAIRYSLALRGARSAPSQPQTVPASHCRPAPMCH